MSISHPLPPLERVGAQPCYRLGCPDANASSPNILRSSSFLFHVTFASRLPTSPKEFNHQLFSHVTPPLIYSRHVYAVSDNLLASTSVTLSPLACCATVRDQSVPAFLDKVLSLLPDRIATADPTLTPLFRTYIYAYGTFVLQLPRNTLCSPSFHLALFSSQHLHLFITRRKPPLTRVSLRCFRRSRAFDSHYQERGVHTYSRVIGGTCSLPLPRL